jgi:hypothetical protein
VLGREGKREGEGGNPRGEGAKEEVGSDGTSVINMIRSKTM